MKNFRTARVVVCLLAIVASIAAVGLVSAREAAAACAIDFTTALTPLSVEHPRTQPVVRTQVIAPFMVRASSKVPLLAGHAKYYSRTYLAFFSRIRLHDSTDIYLL